MSKEKTIKITFPRFSEIEFTLKANILFIIGIFVISTTVLMFEVTLTRIFSLVLLNHFVVLIISLAIFGLGIGAFLIYIFRYRSKYDNPLKIIVFLSFLLSLMYICSTLFIIHYSFLDLFVYVIFASIPFIFAGAILSLSYIYYHKHYGKIYFADLSGASIGCILVIISQGIFVYPKP